MINYGWNFEAMRKMQAERKAANKATTLATANRDGRGSSLAQMRALEDADPKLMEGNSVDTNTIDPRQFGLESERSFNALLASLTQQGHALSDKGIKKFLNYLSHHVVGDFVIDTRRVDVLVAAFNRASNINLFSSEDFVQSTPKTTQPLTGREKEKADRDEYLADLRNEIGEKRFAELYGQGTNPLGARRANIRP